MLVLAQYSAHFLPAPSNPPTPPPQINNTGHGCVSFSCCVNLLKSLRNTSQTENRKDKQKCNLYLVYFHSLWSDKHRPVVGQILSWTFQSVEFHMLLPQTQTHCQTASCNISEASDEINLVFK